MTEWNVLDVLPLGIVMINRQFTVIRWNRWMEMYSGIAAVDIEETNLFHHFPDLNKPSFLRSCRTVFTFGNVVYLSQKLHRYLFPFRLFGSRSPTGVEMMQQSCSMTPIRSEGDEVDTIAITVQDVTDSVILEQRLRQLNQIDGLTGAYNRRFLDHRLAEEIDRHRRYDRTLSIILMDLDHFKLINDQRGHAEGDHVLRTFRTVADAEMRRSDFFCRYGGEEFVALLPETGVRQAEELAERMRARLENTVFPAPDESGPYRVTASFGIATLTEDMPGADALLAQADANMYRAKEAGRNRVVATAVHANE